MGWRLMKKMQIFMSFSQCEHKVQHLKLHISNILLFWISFNLFQMEKFGNNLNLRKCSKENQQWFCLVWSLNLKIYRYERDKNRCDAIPFYQTFYSTFILHWKSLVYTAVELISTFRRSFFYWVRLYDAIPLWFDQKLCGKFELIVFCIAIRKQNMHWSLALKSIPDSSFTIKMR